MILQDFINKWTGQGCDFDHFYGFQCKDIANQYAQDVNGKNLPAGNAIDMAKPVDGYDWIVNTPTGIPQSGDIIVWGKGVGAYGHIAIFIDGNANTFRSFDQNWPVGSLCHIQEHNYNNVLGWLHFKNTPAPEVLPALPADWNSADYLAANPDVAAAGVDPIAHWQHFGFKENRKLHPDPAVVQPTPEPTPVATPEPTQPVVDPTPATDTTVELVTPVVESSPSMVPIIETNIAKDNMSTNTKDSLVHGLKIVGWVVLSGVITGLVAFVGGLHPDNAVLISTVAIVNAVLASAKKWIDTNSAK